MNLAIIGADESPRIKTEGLKKSMPLIKINGDYLIERIIRIGQINGMQKIICNINSKEQELKDYLLSGNLGVQLELFVRDTISSMQSLFSLARFLLNAPFCLATINSVFLENDFSDFINYSLLQEKIDGVTAISNHIRDNKPLCVSMNDKDKILKFSDSKEGYNWSVGGIYYFSPEIFNEMDSALQVGILKLRNYLKFLITKRYILKGFPFSFRGS